MDGLYKLEHDDIVYYFFSNILQAQTLENNEILHIEIYLTDCNNSYNGKLRKQELAKLLKQSKLNKQEFDQVAVESFTGRNNAGIEIKTSKINKKEALILNWKKLISGSDIKILAGSVVFEEISSQVFYSSFYEKMSLTKNQFEATSHELNTLKEQYILMNEKLNELVDIKEKTEKDLYSKFVLLLNSKKEKIKQLKSGILEAPVLLHSDIASKVTERKATKSKRRKNISIEKELNLKQTNNMAKATDVEAKVENMKVETIIETPEDSNIIKSQDNNISLVFENTEDYDEDELSSVTLKKKMKVSNDNSSSIHSLDPSLPIETLAMPNSIYNQDTVDLFEDLI